MAAIAPIVSGQFLAAQDKALYMGIMQEPSGIDFDRMEVFNLKTSNQRNEKFSTNSLFGTFAPKPVGGSPVQDTAQQLWIKYIWMRSFGKRIDITMEAMQDDPKGIIRQVWDAAKELRNNWEYTLETLHWNYLTSIWSTATAALNLYQYGASYYPLFSLTHVTATPGVTWRNRFTNSVQLNRATLEAGITQMGLNCMNWRGQLQGYKPAKILTGWSLAPTVARLLANQGVPESADNGPNWIAGQVRGSVAPMLFTNDGSWALMADKSKLDFFTFNRMGLQVQNLSVNDTLNSSRVAAARVGYGGITPIGWFGNVPA